MTRFLLGVVAGGLLSGWVVSDHFGHLGTMEPTYGIMCRAHRLNAVVVGDRDYSAMLCIDLSTATPEVELWEEMISHYAREMQDIETEPTSTP